MRAFAAVFTREIFERRFAFVVALFAGFVPLIGSLAYGWRSPDAGEGRVLVAFVGATALSAAFAILLGAAVIVGETKEKRISFYFSRPIPSASLWAGKLLAAIAITLATAFLAFAPGWLSGNGRARKLWGLDATLGRTALAALALAVVFVLGSHAVVTVARLRSPWVALDLILAAALVFLAGLALRTLLRDTFMTFAGGSPGINIAAISVAGLAVAVALALTFASLAQVAEGRTDARRAHGAFSVVFFGISGLAVTLVGGYAAWCASARVTDLAQISGSVQAAPRGPWLLAAGPLRAGRGGAAFLFDASGDRSLRVRGYDTVFSQDGMHAAWGERRFGFSGWAGTAEILIADLATGRVIETGIRLDSWWTNLALSPTGRRLAVRSGKTITVYDLSNPANPRNLSAYNVATERRTFAFVDEETLRVFPRVLSNTWRHDLEESQIEISELSLLSKKSLVTGRLDRETLPFLRLSPDARFFVGTRRLSDDALPDQVLTLRDGSTAAQLATLADRLRSPQARFLTGNRIAVLGLAGASARLLFFEGEKGWGAPARTIDLGPAMRVALGGEIATGRVVVALNSHDGDDDAARREWKSFSVEAATGSRAPLPNGLVPVNRFGFWYNAILPPAEASSPASSLFLDADGRLVRLDPATGARTVLLGKGK
jgi:ABC-type transport system involved in multi-copper enzyme maturation permease subunit